MADTSPELIAAYVSDPVPDTVVVKQCSVCGKDVAVNPPGQAILAVNPGLIIYCHPCSELFFKNPPVITADS